MSANNDDDGLIDKFGRFALAVSGSNDPDIIKLKESLEKDLPSTVDTEGIKAWIPRAIESLRKDNPDERVSGREGKIFRAPVNYAMLDSNMQDRKLDLGLIIHAEIEKHGRQTPDELLKHIDGFDKYLVTMAYMSMLQDNYLRWFIEDDDSKTRTLELVEISPEEQLEMQNKKMLADKIAEKTKKKKRGRKSKKSILEKIKVVDPSPVSSKIKVQNVQFLESPIDKQDEVVDEINRLVRDSPNWQRNWKKS